MNKLKFKLNEKVKVKHCQRHNGPNEPSEQMKIKVELESKREQMKIQVEIECKSEELLIVT